MYRGQRSLRDTICDLWVQSDECPSASWATWSDRVGRKTTFPRMQWVRPILVSLHLVVQAVIGAKYIHLSHDSG